MQNDADMSIDASNALPSASELTKHEENPADVSGMSLDDIESVLDDKYNPQEVATAVMLQDPESDDEDGDGEYIPNDDEEEVDELADDQELEPEPKPERGRLAGSNEEDMEIVRRIYGTDNPFYSESSSTYRPSTAVLDEVDQEEATMTDGEESDEDELDDDEDEEEVKPSVDCGITFEKLDLKDDDDDDDDDYVPEE